MIEIHHYYWTNIILSELYDIYPIENFLLNLNIFLATLITSTLFINLVYWSIGHLNTKEYIFMEIKQIKYFLTVVEAGSIGKAAQKTRCWRFGH